MPFFLKKELFAQSNVSAPNSSNCLPGLGFGGQWYKSNKFLLNFWSS